MALPHSKVYFGDRLVEAQDATLGVATSAVLYGLSVYTVFPVQVDGDRRTAFRLLDHYRRLVESCKIIGIDTFASQWTFERFVQATRDVVAANAPTTEVYVRATVHVDESIPGTRYVVCTPRSPSSCTTRTPSFRRTACGLKRVCGDEFRTTPSPRVPR
ncbi:hypothetical protein [Rhodococcus sp. BS-15]|uniref:hypothetical protein n=1 Tax=Rhodococcus sp. BS-15 TaxID=1304954 RepID=UPI001F2A631A|nr:hypothetical protein [Rhodococcus sp. BS-15]